MKVLLLLKLHTSTEQSDLTGMSTSPTIETLIIKFKMLTYLEALVVVFEQMERRKGQNMIRSGEVEVTSLDSPDTAQGIAALPGTQPHQSELS